MECDFSSIGDVFFLQGFQILGLDKKTEINSKAFYPEPKFETLAAVLIFEGAWMNYE